MKLGDVSYPIPFECLKLYLAGLMEHICLHFSHVFDLMQCCKPQKRLELNLRVSYSLDCINIRMATIGPLKY